MKEYQQQLDTRRQHVKQLDAALQIVEAPPEVPQLIQFAKKVLQSRKGPSYAGSAWPTEAKRMLLEFFFGIPHRKPMGPGDPLTEPGIYLDRRKGKDGGDELVWEGRGVFGTVDRSGFHGQAMTQQKVFEFFRSYPFADLARKPFGKALGGKLANAVARAGTRAKSCGARSRSIAPR